MAQTPFRVNDDSEISQIDPEYNPELGQSNPIVWQVTFELGMTVPVYAVFSV